MIIITIIIIRNYTNDNIVNTTYTRLIIIMIIIMIITNYTHDNNTNSLPIIILILLA